MITGDQVSTARRLLGWSLIRLSGYSGVSDVTIEKFERGKGRLESFAPNIEAIRRALELGGVEFTHEQPGVKLKAKSR
ncbi:MAG TPA: helix-turn-helix transcriptional regulator [Roseiarcus sp.]|nr:helix-turn-helix transcriptional regulator [Roseiarcus sp.]